MFTVEAMMPHLKEIKGKVCKNLFVKEKKKKKLWLITAEHSKQFTLNDLAKKLGISGGFRFADESILFENLSVKQGCVTPMALLMDEQINVAFILDSDLKDISPDDGMIYSHPMVNDASIGMTSSDFIKFIEATGHNPVIVNFNEL